MPTEANRFARPGPDLRPVEAAAGPSWSHGLPPARLSERVHDGIVARARARTPRAVPRPGLGPGLVLRTRRLPAAESPAGMPAVFSWRRGASPEERRDLLNPGAIP